MQDDPFSFLLICYLVPCCFVGRDTWYHGLFVGFILHSTRTEFSTGERGNSIHLAK